MKSYVLAVCLILVAASIPVAAAAQEDEALTPDEVALGELSIKFNNTEFPSLRVDGASWENTEYSADGRKAAVQMLDRTQEHVITLISNSPKLGDTELTVKPDDWKLVKVNKLDRAWRAEKSVTFPKKAPPPKVEKPVEQEGAEAPAETAP